MCDVCCADEALRATRCKSKSCKAFDDGAIFDMNDAPKIQAARHPFFTRRAPRRLKDRGRRRELICAPSVHVRARGATGRPRDSEGPGVYQIRLAHEPWPKTWTKSKDLAGSMGLYGLDVKWRYKPMIVRKWILGLRKMPTEAEIHATFPKFVPPSPRKIALWENRMRKEGYRPLEKGEKANKNGYTYAVMRGVEGRFWVKKGSWLGRGRRRRGVFMERKRGNR
jgi:hypothetical protein